MDEARDEAPPAETVQGPKGAPPHKDLTLDPEMTDADEANLCLSIADDGVGGADLSKGSGLIGLIDRVEALGGQLRISSVVGSGTSLLATIPVKGS